MTDAASTTDARVAIVTGGARGIGAAIAKRLAADGMAVGVVDLVEEATADTVAAITEAGGRGLGGGAGVADPDAGGRAGPAGAAGGRALGVGADVADRDAVERAVQAVADGLGAPTVLVNNAGILRDNLIFKMT